MSDPISWAGFLCSDIKAKDKFSVHPGYLQEMERQEISTDVPAGSASPWCQDLTKVHISSRSYEKQLGCFM